MSTEKKEIITQDTSDEPAIEVSHVSKAFKVFLDKGFYLKDLVLFSKRRKYEERKVLNDISFNVNRGEAIALIGHNGCGKSTTLKLLTRIMYPDSGTIKMRGRVSSLIELGAGFHPDMSGRENIYINASIFGLTKEEIDERLDDIIEFSELEDYIDNPVRTYSSGMYMRLAFSVAINVSADILLIDEILAVGDASFQAKCMNKLREIKAAGTTIVLVSHAMGQVEEICERSIWINDGKIVQDGPARDVDNAYLDFMNREHEAHVAQEAAKKAAENGNAKNAATDTDAATDGNDSDQDVHKKASITKISFVDNEGNDIHVLKSGKECTAFVYYHVETPVENAVFGFSILRNDGLLCWGTNTSNMNIDKFSVTQDGMFSFHFDSLNLLPAVYRIDVSIEEYPSIPVDFIKEACTFEVVSTDRDSGLFRPKYDCVLDLKGEGMNGARLNPDITSAEITCDDILKISDEESIYFPVKIRDTGMTILQSLEPFPVRLSYHILDKNKDAIKYDCDRTILSKALYPGESEEVLMKINAKELKGAEYIQIDLIQENAFWFECNRDVRIQHK